MYVSIHSGSMEVRNIVSTRFWKKPVIFFCTVLALAEGDCSAEVVWERPVWVREQLLTCCHSSPIFCIVSVLVSVPPVLPPFNLSPTKMLYADLALLGEEAPLAGDVPFLLTGLLLLALAIADMGNGWLLVNRPLINCPLTSWYFLGGENAWKKDQLVIFSALEDFFVLNCSKDGKFW